MATYSILTLRKYNPDIKVEILLILDKQKDNRYIGGLEKFNFGCGIECVDTFVKYCKNYNIDFNFVDDLDMKEEKGFHSLQRVAFTRLKEEDTLLLDADTFIFDDLKPFFNSLKYHDMVVDLTEWARWNRVLQYEGMTFNSLNSGVVLTKSGLLQEYGKQLYELSLKLKGNEHPYGKWLSEIEKREGTTGKLGREEVAFAFFVNNNNIKYRLSDAKEIQTNNRMHDTLIHHTQTQNYIRYWNMYFGSGNFKPRKKMILRHINKT
jgi:hypothetical protein